MAPDIVEPLRQYFASYGYWTLALTLLLENAGVPVPGESALLVASFLAHQHEELSLGLIILVGTVACTLGDNLGYWMGHRGGRTLLDRHRKFFHISDRIIQRGEKLFASYGAVTILFARFVVGLRVIAGPLAGVLAMSWRKFAICNVLGAACWVTTIAGVGYAMGHHWHRLVQVLSRVNVVVILVMALLLMVLWWRNRQPEQ